MGSTPNARQDTVPTDANKRPPGNGGEMEPTPNPNRQPSFVPNVAKGSTTSGRQDTVPPDVRKPHTGNGNGHGQKIPLLAVDKTVTDEAQCHHCGGSMDGKRYGARYCSNACKQAAYRQRMRE